MMEPLRSWLKMLPIVIFLMASMATAQTSHTECSEVTARTIRLSVESTRNASGDWVTTFSAFQDQTDDSEGGKLDIKHAVVDCGGKQVLQIRGVFTDSSSSNRGQPLRFHQKCGTNVAVTNGGRTIEKLNVEDRINAVALTSRPLKTNELFEVKVDKRVNKLGYFMGIGVTTLSPHKDAIPPHLNSIKSGTWMFYHAHVFHNSSLLIKEFKRNMDHTQIGDRIGVKISETGTLHLYYNGADVGPGASNVPENLYGGFELYGDLAQVTITS